MMRKLIVAALAFIGTACSTKNPSGDMVIRVEVDNPTSDKVELVIDRTANYTIELDGEGRGSTTLTGLGDAFPTVVYGEDSSKKIFLEKGRNATVRFDSRTFKEQGVEVDGHNEDACEFLQEVTMPKAPDFKLKWDEFRAELDKKYDEVVANMTDRGLDRKCPEFFEVEKARLEYMFAHTYLIYPLGHAMKAGEFTYDDTYYDELSRLIVEREELLWVDSYRSFLERAIPILLEKKQSMRSAYEKSVATMRYIADNFKNERVRQTLICTIAQNYILAAGDKQTESMQELVRGTVTDPELLRAFDDMLANLDPLSVGFVSPDFQAVDMKGKAFSLKDFAGNYVYVDVWASWCNPCRKEQEQLKKLEKLFEGRRIAFVSLSVDEDKAAWERAVKEGKLVGTHLWMGKDTEFQKIYNIKSIPRFILLDKSGRIMDANMTAPSDEKTALTLRKLKFI